MKKLLVLFCGVALLASCNKDDDDDKGSNPGGREQILTQGTWKITSSKATTDVSGMPISYDLFTLMEPCVQDNLYTFNTNYTGTTDEGATKCDPNDPQTFSGGNWQMLNNETQLKLTVPLNGTPQDITAAIQKLDNSEMVLTYTTNYNGIAMETTTSYSHQP